MPEMNKLYRIFTEGINYNETRKILDSYLDGYTLIKGQGFWKGFQEDTLIIEVIASEDDRKLIRKIGLEIKTVNGQESVLLETLNNHSELI